jgi:hypothetical protein
MQGVFPKRKSYKSGPVRCWCFLIGGFGHAFARIIRRIDVGDRKRSVAVNLHNCARTMYRRERIRTRNIDDHLTDRETEAYPDAHLPATFRRVVLCSGILAMYLARPNTERSRYGTIATARKLAHVACGAPAAHITNSASQRPNRA